MPELIGLAHGNGGRLTRALIDEVFVRHLANPELDVSVDAVSLRVDGELLFTTDGFTVQPLEFPGGDIGALAVHGTVNDLAVSGAKPLYLSLGVLIEEGLALELLERVVASMAEAARECGVRIVTGDTKVLPKGHGGGLYLTTTGIGARQSRQRLGMHLLQAGDALLVSGPVGDHGAAIMLAREQFGLRGTLHSDCGSVLNLARVLMELDGLRFMRDPTRGGLATVTHDLAQAIGATVRLREVAIPVQDTVRSVCDILGYDPLYLACEGRVVAVVDAAEAERALALWQSLPEGQHAALIGHVEAGQRRVVLDTELGGERFLEMLEDDPLPRIC